jgi:hypothetical protein
LSSDFSRGGIAGLAKVKELEMEALAAILAESLPACNVHVLVATRNCWEWTPLSSEIVALVSFLALTV